MLSMNLVFLFFLEKLCRATALGQFHVLFGMCNSVGNRRIDERMLVDAGITFMSVM